MKYYAVNKNYGHIAAGEFCNKIISELKSEYKSRVYNDYNNFRTCK